MEFMFEIFPFFFMIMFCLIFGMIVFQLVKGVGEWNKNNHSPKLTVDATVVTKRGQIHRHHNSTTHAHTTSTTYYVTFQVESGDRMELRVDGTDFGLLVEGDVGKLTFQGTRFLGFERII